MQIRRKEFPKEKAGKKGKTSPPPGRHKKKPHLNKKAKTKTIIANNHEAQLSTEQKAHHQRQSKSRQVKPIIAVSIPNKPPPPAQG
jgi:hypothetical protein